LDVTASSSGAQSYLIPKPKVVLVGHPFAPIGMGEHLRCSFRALRALGMTVGLRDVYGARTDDSDIQAELGEHLVQGFSPDVNIFYLNGDEIAPSLERLGGRLPETAYNVIYPMWELSQYPKEWAGQLDKFDEVWAPSKFIYESIAPRMPFCFFLTLPPTSSVRIRLRSCRHSRSSASIAPTKSCASLSRSKAGRSKGKITGHSRSIALVDEEFRDNEIKNLLRCCDCFVSLHRSEGFGLGLIAAMFLGKPVVATGYSGNLDFMTEKNSCLVRYELCEVPKGAYPFPEGQVWAEPNMAHAAKHMLKLVSDREYARELGENANRDIRVNFSYRATGLRYLHRIKEILA
jgi:hypothetical protein